MAIDIVILLLAIFSLFGFLIADTRRGRSEGSRGLSDREELWASAISNEDSSAGRILLHVGRRVADSKTLQDQVYGENDEISPAYRALQSKLFTSGTYGGNVEVYLATQIAALVGAITFALLVLISGASGLPLVIGTVVSAIVAWLPYDRVSKGAKRRIQAVNENLPDFAEMLTMPLAVGEPILGSLKMVADEIDGPVSDEVSLLVSNIESRAMDEPAAFALAAERLGTQEARSFFASLLQATTAGTSVNSLILAQAKSLRESEFQRRRAANRKLPNALVFIFGIHFIPFLLGIILVPALLSIGGAL